MTVRLALMVGAVFAFGATDVAATTPPTTPTTPAPTTTAAPATTTTAAPPPTTPPPTIPYPTTVEQDCADEPNNDALADELEALKGDDGSTHLVVIARYCGILFSDKAEVDPDLDRPWSNLEYAINDEDEPFYTSAYDDVTANKAQIELVTKASTEEWYVQNPDLVPKTTAPPTTLPPTTVAATTVPTDGTVVASTTEPEEDEDNDVDGDPQTETGNSAWQIIGVLMAGIGAAVWGVSGVRNTNNADGE